jgi:membrane protein required for colicin V production
MNWLDAIIIIILGIGLIRGFTDGLIVEISKILALVLGIFISIHFSGWTASRLSDYFDIQSTWLGITAFIITFTIVVVAVNLLGRLLDKLLKVAALGFFIRLAGAVFGVIKMALILSVVFVFINTVNQHVKILPEKVTSKSHMYNPIADIIPSIFPIVEGGDLLDSFNRYKKPHTGNPI